jgi:hypothetical protein
MFAEEPSRSPSRLECRSCGVTWEGRASTDRCRCCVADDDTANSEVAAETAASQQVLPPPPDWTHQRGKATRLEMARVRQPDGAELRIGLWWSFRGDRWVPRHPMEFPVNRMDSLGGV